MEEHELTIAQLDRMLEDLELKKITLQILSEQLDKLAADMNAVRYIVGFMDKMSRETDDEA